MDLKTARLALGWSQADMDRRARVNRGTTQEIESGKNANPTVAVAFKLFAALRTAGLEGLTIEQVFPRDVVAERETRPARKRGTRTSAPAVS